MSNARWMDATIEDVAAMAYETAGLQPGSELSTIAPLEKLIAAQPLFVDEVLGLTSATAAQHFNAQTHRAIHIASNVKEPLSGFLYANLGGGWILVEGTHPLVRRRFTIAHELGHYLLHFLPKLETATAGEDDGVELCEQLLAPKSGSDDDHGSVGQLTFYRGPRPDLQRDAALAAMEREADHFAAEVLMPEAVCRDAAMRLATRYAYNRSVLVQHLATDFLVSEAAMWRRLRDLDIVGETRRGF